MFKDAVSLTWRTVAVLWVLAGALYLTLLLIASSTDGDACKNAMYICFTNQQIVNLLGVIALVALTVITVVAGIGVGIASIFHARKMKRLEAEK